MWAHIAFISIFFYLKTAGWADPFCGAHHHLLFVFGYFKSRVTGQPPVKGELKVTAIGLIAAGAAFLIARLIT